MKFYFNQKLINYNKPAQIYKRIEEIQIKDNSRYSGYLKVFFDFIVLSDFHVTEKINYINWYLHIIKKLNFLDQSHFSKLVVMDEGLLNNNPNIEESIDELRQIFPKGCIFFHLDMDSNLARIKNRGKLRGIHKRKTNEQLAEYVLADHQKFKRKRSLLIREGIPFVDIYLNEKMSENIGLAEGFLCNMGNSL